MSRTLIEYITAPKTSLLHHSNSWEIICIITALMAHTIFYMNYYLIARGHLFKCRLKPTMVEIKLLDKTAKFARKVAFHRYTESVKFRSQSRKNLFKTKTIPRTGH